MLQEIAYWTYYFCHKNHFLRQNGEEVLMAPLFFALNLYVNALSIIHLIEFWIGIHIMELLPWGETFDLLSYIVAFCVISPFVYLGYKSYFHPHKLSELIKKYERKQVYRKRWGKFFYTLYVIITYCLFFFVVETFKI